MKSFVNIFIFSCLLCFVQCQKGRQGSSCISYSARGVIVGRCVLYKRCLSLLQDHKDGVQPQICSYENNMPVVCCTDCKLVKDIDMMVVDPTIGYRFKDGSKAWDYCLDAYQNLPYLFKDHYSWTLERIWNPRKQCFHIEFTSIAAAGGEDAVRGEYPHMALLGYGNNRNALQWLCGGSLISSRFILTAAHCSASARLGPVTYAAMGMLRRSDPDRYWHKYKIKKIIMHPLYRSPSKYNDIALLKTEERVKFFRDVLPACLHSRDTRESHFGWAIATGWGALGKRKKQADTLQRVHVLEFMPEECSALYQPHRNLKKGFDHSTQICYGSRDQVKDTCSGDSGGPLQISSGIMADILGVTSSGIECGEPGQAGIYTRVEPYVPWIESIVWP